MSAASALQRAIFARLSGDAALTALVGANGITDRRPDGPATPLLVIAGIDSTDHSTASEAGEEHIVTLEAWSEAAGHRQAQAIAAAVRAARRRGAGHRRAPSRPALPPRYAAAP